MQERNAWVDYAKAIGIILVVYGHVARGVFNAGLPMDEGRYVLLDSIIYSFHMPLFFFLSGLFFYDSLMRRGRAGLIVNKVDTVVYPFLLWSLLQGMFEVVLSDYTNGSVTVSQVLSSLVWSPRAQFWFLYALFLVFLVCAFVYAKASRRFFLPILLVFSALYVFRQDMPANSALQFVLGNAVFFALGIWINEIKAFLLLRHVQLLALFGALFVLGQYVFHITLGLTWDVGGLPALVLATISILFMVTLSMWLGRFRIRWLLFVGASSMTIYLLHILAGSGVRVMMGAFLDIDSIVAHLLVGTLVGLAAPLLVQLIIQRYNLYFLLSPPRPISATYLRARAVPAS